MFLVPCQWYIVFVVFVCMYVHAHTCVSVVLCLWSCEAVWRCLVQEHGKLRQDQSSKVDVPALMSSWSKIILWIVLCSKPHCQDVKFTCMAKCFLFLDNIKIVSCLSFILTPTLFMILEFSVENLFLGCTGISRAHHQWLFFSERSLVSSSLVKRFEICCFFK
jgi:hypothetical protein